MRREVKASLGTGVGGIRILELSGIGRNIRQV